MYKTNFIILGVVLLIVLYFYFGNSNENFQQKAEVHPDVNFQKFLTSLNKVESESYPGSNSVSSVNSVAPPQSQPPHDMSKFVLKSSIEPRPQGPDLSQYIRRTDVERVAREAASKACPVAKGYDPDDYIKKSEIPPPNSNCPTVPDLKDFVLKSTIPPTQQCPPCVCPKVKVSAGLCKKQFPKKFTCPPPKPCDTDECRKIVKCLPGTYPRPPKQECPKVLPCPPTPNLICPPCKVPNLPKCPPPKPCPKERPCPTPTRCPPIDPKCRYYGVKKICDKPIDQLIKEVINSGNAEDIQKIQNATQMMASSPIDYIDELKKND